MASYTIARYQVFPSHANWGVGTFGNDNHTDNQVNSNYNTRWVPGEWRVPANEGDWGFNEIRELNYFLETVLPKWEENAISGSEENIAHYIGEAYFLRRSEEHTSELQSR